MIKEIEVCKTIKKNGNGVEFPAYSAKNKDGNWVQCKFTRECVKNAIERGIKIPEDRDDENRFIMVVESLACNVSKNGPYPCLWVKQVEEIKDIPIVDDVNNMF